MEKELRDREQDIVELQRDLSEAEEKLSKCKSLLTTREWLISRDEIEIIVPFNATSLIGYPKLFWKAGAGDRTLGMCGNCSQEMLALKEEIVAQLKNNA